MLAAEAVGGDRDYGALLQSSSPIHGGLDFAEFYPITAHFDLCVGAAHNKNQALFITPCKVSGAI